MKRLFLLWLILGTLSLQGASRIQNHEDQKEKPDRELMKLSLEVMLYNNDLNHAWRLVKKGVRYFPSDPYWLKEAGEIALWTNHPRAAKRYLYRLYRIEHNPKIADKLFALADMTQDRDLTIDLLESRIEQGDYRSIEKLLKAYYERGFLLRGIRFFHRLNRRHPSKEALEGEILLKIAAHDTLPRLRKLYRKYRLNYGDNIRIATRYAHVLFVHKRIQEAFDLMHRISGSVSPEKEEFWYLYFDLAAFLQKEDLVYSDMKRLFRQNLFRKQDYERMIRLAERKEPEFVLQVAAEEWKRFGTMSVFFRYMAILERSKRYDTMREMMGKISPSFLKRVKKDPRYWMIRAELFEKEGKSESALQSFGRAVKLSPDAAEVRRAYLWFLIDHRKTALLERELMRLSRSRLSKLMPSAMAAGYMALQQSNRAKRYLERLIRRSPRDWRLRIFYSDLLMLWQDRRGARRQMRIAWQDARKSLKKIDIFGEQKYHDLLYDYLRLLLYFHPKEAKKVLKKAQAVLCEKEIADLYLGVLTNTHATEKIAFLKRRYHNKAPWLRLYLAIDRYDTDEMQNLLKSHRRDLPITDHALAAQRAGMEAKAVTLMFMALEENPKNQDLAALFHESVIKRGPSCVAGAEYIRRGSLKYRKYRIKIDRPLTLAWRFSGIYERREYIPDTTAQRPLPDRQNDLSLSLERQIERGKLSIISVFYDNLPRSVGFLLDGSYRYGPTRVGVTAGIDQRDDTNEKMLLFGLKDRWRLYGDFSYTSSDHISASIHQNRYYLDGKSIGKSFGGGIAYEKRIRSGYPDIKTGIYGMWELYRSHIADFLPKGYWQISTGGSFGEESKERFSRRWRPFGSVYALYHSRNGTGYRLTAGVGGMVYDRDRVFIEMVYSSGTGHIPEEMLSLQVRYLYW